MRKKKTVAPALPRFVPPAERKQPAPTIDIPEADVSGVWDVTPSNSVDGTSAEDRARAFIIRNKPMYFAVAVFALGASLLWTGITMAFGIGMPLAIDKILVFSVVMSSTLMWLHLRSSKLDYEHSESGIKRLQIIKGYEYAIEQLRSRERIQLAAFKQLTDKESDDE